MKQDYLVDKGWQAMSDRLDEVMPDHKGKRRKRFFIYLIMTGVAALLIGLLVGRHTVRPTASASDDKTSTLSGHTLDEHAYTTTEDMQHTTSAGLDAASTDRHASSLRSDHLPETDVANEGQGHTASMISDDMTGTAAGSLTQHSHSPSNTSNSSSKNSHTFTASKAFTNANQTSHRSTHGLSLPIALETSSDSDASAPSRGRSDMTDPTANTFGQEVAKQHLSATEAKSLDAMPHMAMPLLAYESSKLNQLNPSPTPSVLSQNTTTPRALQFAARLGGFMDDAYSGGAIGLEVGVPLSQKLSLVSGIGIAQWHREGANGISLTSNTLSSVENYTRHLVDEGLSPDQTLAHMWSIDLPLGLAYQITDRWSVRGGIVANIPVSYRAQDVTIVDAPGTSASRSQLVGEEGLTTDDFVRTQSTTNWLANIEVGYHFSPSWSLYLGYQHGLSDFHANVTTTPASSFSPEVRDDIYRPYFSQKSEGYRPRLMSAGVRYGF